VHIPNSSQRREQPARLTPDWQSPQEGDQVAR
jgi:hypothetical protein